MNSSVLEINFFGNESNKKRVFDKIEMLKKNINHFKIFLIIAGTNTSQIPGISAAGRTPNTISTFIRNNGSS